MRNRWKAAVTARKREEAGTRQAAYDALTPQEKFDRAVTRSSMDASRARREIERLINGPHGEEIRT